MFEAKDSEGLWWRFSVKPTLTEDGWQCEGHVSAMPNHEETTEDWKDSLKEL